MKDQSGRYTRLRDTATGALAALAVVGAIVGTGALAAQPPAKDHGHASAANAPTKPASPAAPARKCAPTQVTNDPANSFETAVQRLVGAGTITAAEGQAVDHEILAGTLDTDTLASSGFTQSQRQALQQALGDAKRAVAQSVHGGGCG